MTQLDWTLAWGLTAIVVVGGVWLFNLWQERNWRRRANDAFRQTHASDALLGEIPPAPTVRREPSFGPESVLSDVPVDSYTSSPIPVLTERSDPLKAGFLDAEVDYIVTLQLDSAPTADELRRAVEQSNALPRPAEWEGLHELSGWEPLDSANAASYFSVRAGMQLVNRSGPIDQAMLTRFCDMMQYFCDRWSARIQYPDRPHALEQARKLDNFCASVDVVIGLNIVSNDGKPLSMTRVIQLANAAGLKANAPQGWLYSDEERRPLFGLVHIEGQPIDPARARHMTCFGLTFTLDVPRVPGGVAVFDRATALARHFAQQLNADLVDDHRNILTDSALDTIRQQLAVIYSNMELRGLIPGSPLVLRVFC